VGLTEAELAERSACPVERIEELVALGHPRPARR
jgi:hypothetical protein